MKQWEILYQLITAALSRRTLFNGVRKEGNVLGLYNYVMSTSA
jgi:hypothetical protein